MPHRAVEGWRAGYAAPEAVSRKTPAPEAPGSSGEGEQQALRGTCRRSLRRPAPRAARVAVSRARVADRASSRFVTFTQATSSTNPTALHSTSNAGRASPTTRSSSGRMRSFRSGRRDVPPALLLASRIEASSARAVSKNFTPGLSRAITPGSESTRWVQRGVHDHIGFRRRS